MSRTIDGTDGKIAIPVTDPSFTLGPRALLYQKSVEASSSSAEPVAFFKVTTPSGKTETKEVNVCQVQGSELLMTGDDMAKAKIESQEFAEKQRQWVTATGIEMPEPPPDTNIRLSKEQMQTVRAAEITPSSAVGGDHVVEAPGVGDSEAAPKDEVMKQIAEAAASLEGMQIAEPAAQANEEKEVPGDAESSESEQVKYFQAETVPQAESSSGEVHEPSPTSPAITTVLSPDWEEAEPSQERLVEALPADTYDPQVLFSADTYPAAEKAAKDPTMTSEGILQASQRAVRTVENYPSSSTDIVPLVVIQDEDEPEIPRIGKLFNAYPDQSRATYFTHCKATRRDALESRPKGARKGKGKKPEWRERAAGPQVFYEESFRGQHGPRANPREFSRPTRRWGRKSPASPTSRSRSPARRGGATDEPPLE